ncbi:MAG: hypothetical protein QOD77_931 [Thermoplasmata archaeon]|nr:hypothetical protein [Thermoplasmata archaeon]
MRTKAPGRGFDIGAGVVGALLLAGCVALVLLLPVPDEVPSQFRVTFTDHTEDLVGQTQALDDLSNAESHKDFFFEVPHDNVFAVRLQLNFTDDIVASEPDRFKVEVYDAVGDFLPGTLYMSNLPAQADLENPGQYISQEKTADWVLSTERPKPADLIAVGGPATTEADVVAKLSADMGVPTAGKWRVRVDLVATGDCPLPAADSTPDELQRAAACRQEVGGEADPARHDVGNSFTVGVFSYTRFEVTAEKLG